MLIRDVDGRAINSFEPVGNTLATMCRANETTFIIAREQCDDVSLSELNLGPDFS